MQKDNQISEQVVKENSKDVSLSFIKDNNLSLLCKRAMRISKAICLVTQHIEESKDIKVRLQRFALDLSDMTVQLVSVVDGSSVKDTQAVLGKGVSLLNYIEIAHSLGMMSETNSSILIEQVKMFMEDLSKNLSYMETPLKALQLSDFTFDEPQQVVGPVEEVVQVPPQVKPSFVQKLSTANPKEHNASRVSRSSFHPTNAEFRERLASAKTLEDLHGIPVSEPAPQKKSGVFVKSSRQELIIQTITEKGELSIKDLGDVIQGCSEKTIQRELLALVDQGILSKNGERRWSRYALAR